MLTCRMNRAWWAAVFLMTALAGCTSGGGALDAEGPKAGADGSTDLADGMVTVQANASAAEPIVIEGSGSFMPHDAIVASPVLEDDIYRITDGMREDTAYRMTAVLSYQDTAVGVSPGPFYMDIGWEGDVIRDLEDIEYNEGPDGDNQTLTATLLPTTAETYVELTIGMSVDGWFGQPPQEYELTVTLTPVLDRIPQYGAAAVQVPEGGDLVVEPLNGSGRVMVYEGEGEFLGIHEVEGPTTVVNGTEAASEFILVTLDDIWARVSVTQDMDAPAPVLRHLPFSLDVEPIGSIDGSGDQSLSFSVDGRQPARIGFQYGADDCCYTVANLDYSVIGPDGQEVFSGGTEICICEGWSTSTTSYDDGPMPMGDYSIQWYSDDTQGIEVRQVTIHPQS